MKWTKTVLIQMESLIMQGNSNKEIAEIFGTKTEYVINARSRFGLTEVKLKGVASKDRCFANSNGVTCTALRVKNCEDCTFFKTLEQKLIDDEKSRKRLGSLKGKIINVFN